ncbi:MAG: succinate dehydrogenase iron-sulfur subunit, partial [Magnetococcales bacterium]|nr:succinate dehydrogenase iron-sulfur subunit [Magnetococcales bacterium]
MTTQTYTFRIQRNMPGQVGTVQSHWQDYQVEAEPNTTILTALESIKGSQ